MAGATLGVLYAPTEGRNSRRRLTFRLSRYRDRLKELVGEMVNEPHTSDNDARHEGQKVINDAKQKAERLLGDVEELMGQIKNKK